MSQGHKKARRIRAGRSSLVSALSGWSLLFQLRLSLQLVGLCAEFLQRIQHPHYQVAYLAFRGLHQLGRRLRGDSIRDALTIDFMDDEAHPFNDHRLRVIF